MGCATTEPCLVMKMLVVAEVWLPGRATKDARLVSQRWVELQATMAGGACCLLLKVLKVLKVQKVLRVLKVKAVSTLDSTREELSRLRLRLRIHLRFRLRLRLTDWPGCAATGPALCLLRLPPQQSPPQFS